MAKHIEALAARLEDEQKALIDWVSKEGEILQGKLTDLESAEEKRRAALASGQQVNPREQIELERSIETQRNIVERLEQDLDVIRSRNTRDEIGAALTAALRTDLQERLESHKADYNAAAKHLQAAAELIRSINAQIEAEIKEHDRAIAKILPLVPNATGNLVQSLRQQYRPVTIPGEDLDKTLLMLHLRLGEGDSRHALSPVEWGKLRDKYQIRR